MTDLFEWLVETVSGVPGVRYWIALLLVGAAVAGSRALDRIITSGLLRLTQRTKTAFDDLVVERVHRPLTRSAILLGIYAAVLVMRLPTPVAHISVHLLQTLVVAVWVAALWPLVGEIVRWMSAHPTRFRAVQPASQPLFSIASQVVLIGSAAYIGLLLWGIDVAGWATSAGIVGIAVGFAARDTLANLFAGVSILADAPYKTGDYIVLAGASRQRGEVTHIGLRSTRILTRDDIEITIPNATIANSTVINESGGPDSRQRVRLKVGVAYGSDVDRVRAVLHQVARSEPLVCTDREPRVRFRAFADSSLNFELLCWIENAELRGRALDALLTSTHRALQEAGIDIPFPQRVIRLDRSEDPRDRDAGRPRLPA